MKIKSIIIFVFFISNIFFAQLRLREGNVSFQSPTLVYVYFNSTKGIEKGDTLFIKSKTQLKSALIVQYASSFSIASKRISDIEIKDGQKVFAKIKVTKGESNKKSSNKNSVSNKDTIIVARNSSYKSYPTNINQITDVYGRISLSSYSNFSSLDKANTQRWRLSSSLGIKNIADSKISFSSYFNINYRTDQWSDLTQNIGNYLTIYDLSVNYAPNNSMSFSVGRKISPLLSNVGAIDGIAMDFNVNNFLFGAISGYRPNYTDYSINTNLFEYGVYIGRKDSLFQGMMTTKIAFFQQNNHGNIDRRFVYLQHQNNILNNVLIFFSSEIDLYKKINGIESSDFKLTNIYFSLRYRITSYSNISISYDARKNVVYYETFKSFEEKLLDDATRHGLRLTYTLKPFRNAIIGLNGSYINRKGDLQATYNIGIFGSYSRVPYLNLSISLNDNYINTSYISGNIFSIKFYKYLLNNSIYASGGYKNIYYMFPNNAPTLLNNILMVDVGISPYRKTSISVSFEGILEDRDFYGRLLINISQRF